MGIAITTCQRNNLLLFFDMPWFSMFFTAVLCGWGAETGDIILFLFAETATISFNEERERGPPSYEMVPLLEKVLPHHQDSATMTHQTERDNKCQPTWTLFKLSKEGCGFFRLSGAARLNSKFKTTP